MINHSFLPATPPSPSSSDGRFGSSSRSLPSAMPTKSHLGGQAHVVDLLTPPSTPPLESSAVFYGGLHAPVAHREPATSSRKLSDNELSYFLPSRACGVNDMYLHHHIKTARPDLLARDRIELAWAILRVRHPLLTASVRPGASGRMDDWEFHTAAPADLDDAIEEAFGALSFRSYPSAEQLISKYLNGPRLLSAHHLSHLTLSQASATGYDVLLCTTHFVGDGIALHTLMNEFYLLVGDEDAGVPQLERVLEEALEQRQQAARDDLPLSTEERLANHPQAASPIKRAASRVAYAHTQRSSVGGQTFPRPAKRATAVHTVVPTHAYSADDSAKIIKTCKAHGVSFASALFAVVNLAWTRVQGAEMNAKEPMLFYSALNLRPSLSPLGATASESYFHLALGYYTVSLPSFAPSSSAAFWQRCTSVKDQTAKATRSRFLVGKALVEMAERAERAVKWGIIDDAAERERKEREDLAGLGIIGWRPPPTSLPLLPPAPVVAGLRTPPTTPPSTPPPVYSASPAPSNTPLMGLSLLGNLDFMYAHARYPALDLRALTTGSRQRSGAILLFGYTFKRQTYLSLGYDQAGFAPGKIEALWHEMKAVTKQQLVN